MLVEQPLYNIEILMKLENIIQLIENKEISSLTTTLELKSICSLIRRDVKREMKKSKKELEDYYKKQLELMKRAELKGTGPVFGN